jgi:type I restriction enzyme S subunit
VCEINPRIPKSLSGDEIAAFLPMAAVSENGQIDFEEERPISEVRKGYTYFERGDVLVAKITPCFENGKAARTHSLARPIGFGSTEFHVLRAGEQIDPSYLFHLVWNSKFREVGASNMTGSAGQKRVPADFLKRLEIPLPPLDEQRRIAAILDKADTLRRNSRIALVLIDELGHAIYRSSFGDPVRNPLKMPTTTLGELNVEMVYGPRFYDEAYSSEGTRIVRITDLSEAGELNFDAMPKLKISDDELQSHRSRQGELLFARTGATVGKIALISKSDPVCIPGAYFIRLRFPDSVDPTFAWYTLRSAPVQKIIAERSRQSAQQNFSGPGLRRLPFVIPTAAEQAAFAAQIAKSQKSKAYYREQIAAFDSLFSSLQSRAFSGQL